MYDTHNQRTAMSRYTRSHAAQPLVKEECGMLHSLNSIAISPKKPCMRIRPLLSRDDHTCEWANCGNPERRSLLVSEKKQQKAAEDPRRTTVCPSINAGGTRWADEYL